MTHIMSNEIILTFSLGGTYHNSMKSFKYMTERATHYTFGIPRKYKGVVCKIIENFFKCYGHLASAAFDA